VIREKIAIRRCDVWLPRLDSLTLILRMKSARSRLLPAFLPARLGITQRARRTSVPLSFRQARPQLALIPLSISENLEVVA
jgi:hypothetical protein